MLTINGPIVFRYEGFSLRLVPLMHCQQLTTVRNGDIIVFVTGHNSLTKTLNSVDILSFLELVRHATQMSEHF